MKVYGNIGLIKERKKKQLFLFIIVKLLSYYITSIPITSLLVSYYVSDRKKKNKISWDAGI